MTPPKTMSQDEILSAISELDQALYSHDEWVEHVNAALICRLPSDAHDTGRNAYRQCRFGQWYYGAGMERLVGRAGFEELGDEHKFMHQYAASLLRASAAGKEIALQDYERYIAAVKHTRLEIQTLKRELEVSLYNIDALTGVPGRLEMLRKLREQQELVRRKVHPCAIALLDIDRFKVVNDTRGHIAGDQVLVEVARHIQASLRPYDMIFRYGGEEFLLCLPETGMEAAMEACERLRKELAEQEHRVDGGGALTITVSIGVAALEAEVSVEEVLDRADRALAAAKDAGRNRTLCWKPSMAGGQDTPRRQHGPPRPY